MLRQTQTARASERHRRLISVVFAGLLATALVHTGRAQVPDQRKSQQPQAMGGVSTGAAHPAVKDALSRPITAGGFVDGAPVVFLDVTKQAGLDKFKHRSGDPEKRTILETPGSGGGALAFYNDGWAGI